MPTADRMFYEGTIYGFVRDRHSGEGHWIVVHGHCPLLTGHNNAGSFVPLAMEPDLSAHAKENGYTERYNFARDIPKPKAPEPRQKKGPGQPTNKRRSGLVGMGIKLAIGG